MPSASYLQTSFLGGEWSPYAQGRADQEAYRTAMNLCNNGLPLEVGAWTRRPGTKFCGVTNNNATGVLRSFHFSQNAPYNIEFTNRAMRFWSGSTLIPGVTVTPYVTADLQQLRVVQEENFALVLHASYPPETLTATPPAGASPASFTFSPTTLIDGPYLDPPTDGTTLTPNQVGTGLTLAASSIANINGGSGFVATDVGRAIRLFSQPPTWNSSTNYHLGDVVFWKNVAYIATQDAGHAAPDADISTTWAISPSGAQWTWGTIATIIAPNQVTVTLAAADPYTILAGGPLLYVQAIPLWQLGVYSNTTGWPGGGFFHEGRLWLFGTTANRIDSTMSGVSAPSGPAGAINFLGPPCFSPTLLDGTVADNCGISAIMMGEDRNTIFWGVPDHQGIILGTQGGEWLVQASSINEPLTPISIQAHRVTKFGCANVEPRLAGFSHIFVQRYTRSLYEYVADVYSGKFSGTNLARKAKHLTASGIAEIAYQAETTPIIWIRTNASTLVGVTYKRESPFTTQPATFVGWHRHGFGSGRGVISISAGPSPDGTLDSLMMITGDGRGNHWVEQLTNLPEESDSLLDAWFLDSGVVPTVTVSGTSLILSGLPYPNGDTITAWVGGYDLGDAICSGGQITVPAIAGAPTTPAVVGYNYTSAGQILRPVLPQEAGWQTGPGQGKKRRSHYAAPLLVNSQGVFMGVDFATMRAMKFKSAGGTVPLPINQLYSGVYWEPISDTYSFNSMWCWQTTRPYPTTLVSVEIMVEGQDNA